MGEAAEASLPHLDRRDVEASRKFLDRCTTLPLDEFDDESAAFFDEQAGRG